MARIRDLKPGFFMNEKLAELPAEVRLLFAGLWTIADREGRLLDNPRRIKAQLFPYDDWDVQAMLADLAKAGFIQRYEAEGEQYLAVLNFKKHQKLHPKEAVSEIPPPPDREKEAASREITRQNTDEQLSSNPFPSGSSFPSGSVGATAPSNGIPYKPEPGHWAVEAFREKFNQDLSIGAQEEIEARVHDPPMWGRVLSIWRANDHSTRLAWNLIDRYERECKRQQEQNGEPKRAAPLRKAPPGWE